MGGNRRARLAWSRDCQPPVTIRGTGFSNSLGPEGEPQAPQTTKPLEIKRGPAPGQVWVLGSARACLGCGVGGMGGKGEAFSTAKQRARSKNAAVFHFKPNTIRKYMILLSIWTLCGLGTLGV